jgi:hypothetical protein
MPDADATSFTPVPVAPRADGWTAERQRLFILTLSETACVTDACAAVAMSRRSAYRLRARPDAFAFAEAWDQAIRLGAQRLVDVAIERALNGVTRSTLTDRGGCEQIVPETRLLIYLLDRMEQRGLGPFAPAGSAETAVASHQMGYAMLRFEDRGPQGDPAAPPQLGPAEPATGRDPVKPSLDFAAPVAAMNRT